MKPYRDDEELEETEDEFGSKEYLLAKAAEQGFVTYADVLAAFPQVEENLEEVELILAVLMEHGIGVSTPGGREESGEEEKFEQPDQADEAENFFWARFETISMDDTIGLYFKEIGQVPLLTSDEEVALARRIESGRTALERLKSSLNSEEQAELKQAVLDGLTARDHLVCANFRLVISIAKKYIGRGVPFLDLIQEGNIGLIRAANKFDYRLGFRFSTYANWWIRQAVTRTIADQSRTIRVPVHMNDQINRLLRTTHRLTQELGREPTSEELAAALDVPRRKVEEMLRAAHLALSLSLETPTGDEGEGEFGDFIEDEKTVAPDDAVTSVMLGELIKDMVQSLPPREARILQLRYGLVGGETYTLEEVGKKLGVTRERVRQIEVRALSRLRHPVYSRRLRYFME